jgi:hypothetical protein
VLLDKGLSFSFRIYHAPFSRFLAALLPSHLFLVFKYVSFPFPFLCLPPVHASTFESDDDPTSFEPHASQDKHTYSRNFQRPGVYGALSLLAFSPGHFLLISRFPHLFSFILYLEMLSLMWANVVCMEAK